MHAQIEDRCDSRHARSFGTGAPADPGGEDAYTAWSDRVSDRFAFEFGPDGQDAGGPAYPDSLATLWYDEAMDRHAGDHLALLTSSDAAARADLGFDLDF